MNPIALDETPVSCEFYQKSHRPAFIYYQLAPNGSKIEVQAQADANGLCYFPEASCELSNFSCCSLSESMHTAAEFGTMINVQSCLVCLVLPMVCLVCIARLRRRQEAQQALEDEETDEDQEEEESEEMNQAMRGLECETSAGEAETGEEAEPCWRNGLRVLLRVLLVIGFAAELMMLTFTARITQKLLDVPMRNSMMAGEAFLMPVREIFQFLEDVVTVKIMAAVRAGSLAAVRPILSLGVLGGALCGVVAALCITAILSWPAALRWLLAPYAMHEDSLACPLVPKGDDAAATAKMYLLLSAWCWPANFVSMGLRGLFLGLNEWSTLGLSILVPNAIQIVLLFMIFIPDPSLDALGLIAIVGAYGSLLILLVILLLRRGFREQYNLTLGSSEVKPDEMTASVSWREASREGFYAMLLDVAAQSSITVGIYTGGAMLGIGAMYQIAALQAAFPQYGLQYIIGVTYALRLQGTRLVAAEEYQAFKGLFRGTVIYGLLLALVAAATLIPYRVPIAFLQARQACEYASSLECTKIFTSVFGGGDATGGTLQGSAMWIFVPILIARCFYQLYKAGLYACLDWSFMARTGVSSFLLVFLPAICAAVFYFQTVLSIFLAMYLPLLVMAITFMCRTRRNIKRMLSDRSGPWRKEL
ncbi:Hypothetical protein SCF082_LOCUS11868 [Durusdinium trenchii]|uniref:Protein RFT1 homolog n=1 Tax=Durusdinium trenchii TaxID=1381693 RepID=A0ABP0JGG2_9DINO